MDLNQCLLQNPRETSGSLTGKRYDYQKDWSLYKMLELLKTDKNFVAFLDYHEDIIILDLNEGNEKLEFYQIKCVKKTNWTKGQLIKRERGKQGLLNSILGKLTYNFFIFGNFVKSLNFVSNSPLKLKLNDGNDSKNLNSFSLDSSIDKEEIRLKISQELGKSEDQIPTEKIYFIKTNLNEDGSETYVMGKLIEFLSENYPNLSSYCRILYQSLFREIRIKCNASGNFTNIEEVLKKKSISRRDLIEIFSNLEPEKTSKERWFSLENRMNSEGWTLSEIQKIKEKWQKYSILIKDRSDYVLQKMREKIVKGIDNSKSSNNLSEVIANVKDYYNRCKEVNEEIYSEYLLVSILFEYYG